jgi:hypothetical protein
MDLKDQKMDQNSQKTNENGVILRKNSNNSSNLEAIMSEVTQKPEKSVKNIQTSPKKSQKPRNIGNNSSKPSNKRRNAMTNREKCEQVLEEVAKQFKMQTSRISAKRNSSQDGALQLKDVRGNVKITVKSYFIDVYSPKSYLGHGTESSKGYEFVTKFPHTVDLKVLKNVFVKAMKDKKSGNDWCIEMGCTRRAKTSVNLKSRAERLRAELEIIEKQLAKSKTGAIKRKASGNGAKPKVKVKKVVSNAIESVAEGAMVAQEN